MQNSMVMFTFSVFDGKYPFFFANLVQKIKVVFLSWNAVVGLILIMHNSMVMLTFSVSNQKYSFWQIWSEKLKLSFQVEI